MSFPALLRCTQRSVTATVYHSSNPITREAKVPDIPALYDRIAAASSLEGEDAAIRITATFEPAGGPGDKLSPPTYPIGDEKTLPYLFEQRWGSDGEEEKVVLLDSRQAQANRCEEALQVEIDSGRLRLPHLVLRTESNGTPIRITSLQAPHRSRDAYFRDATTPDGTDFDATAVGGALKAVRCEDARALFRHSPTDLVYGVWDSHRSLRLAPRFPRIYTSEVIGHAALEGRRAAGRADLLVSGARKVKEAADGTWTAGDGAKGTRLSELGHGSIPPSEGTSRRRGPGGVTVKSITRMASLGFAGLARVTLGPDIGPEVNRTARAVLAALALLGDRLAFGAPAVFLRSGCELVLTSEELTFVGRRNSDRIELDRGTARELVAYAIKRAGAVGADWAAEPVILQPNPQLQKVIDESFFSAAADDE